MVPDLIYIYNISDQIILSFVIKLTICSQSYALPQTELLAEVVHHLQGHKRGEDLNHRKLSFQLKKSQNLLSKEKENEQMMLNKDRVNTHYNKLIGLI